MHFFLNGMSRKKSIRFLKNLQLTYMNEMKIVYKETDLTSNIDLFFKYFHIVLAT